MEFNLTTDIKKSIPTAIVFNFEELKSELTKKIQPYKSSVVSESDIKGAKSDKAALNKLKKALNDKRVEVKKEYMVPLETFESQVKELVQIVEEGVTNIDTQVKEYERIETEKKRDCIQKLYNNEFADLTELIPLDKVIPEKWSNKGCKLTDIEKEFKDKAFKIKNDIQVIRAMKLDCEDMVLDAYVRTLDMSTALQEKHDFEERQKVLKKKVKVEQTNSSENALESKQDDEILSEELKTIDVRFYDTTAQFRTAMKQLTQQYNIRYGNVPKGE